MPRLKQAPKRPKGRIKEPVIQPTSTNTLSPVFCLHYLAPMGYGLDGCEVDEKVAFAHKLRELCQLTWNQIINAPRHGMGSEKIERHAITGSNIPAHITEDVDFIGKRFDGLKRMEGYRFERVFHVIWLDTKFTLYSHGR